MREPVLSKKKVAISKAERQFTATQKKDDKALKEKEKAKKDAADKVARLRGLRLEKETAAKNAAEKAGAK